MSRVPDVPEFERPRTAAPVVVIAVLILRCVVFAAVLWFAAAALTASGDVELAAAFVGGAIGLALKAGGWLTGNLRLE